MINKIIPVILCGGAGSRLWPVSREDHPKPFIRLPDGKSLLQKAYERALDLNGVTEVLTVTNRDLYFKIKDEYAELPRQARSNSYILEPFGRNTAAAVAVASEWVRRKHGDDAVMLVLAADHLISDQEGFEKAVSQATALAHSGRIVTFGIQPEWPETGYGYIEAEGNNVIRFIEKPALEVAKEYIQTGRHLWNSGIFCFQVQSILKEMQNYCQDIYSKSVECLQASIDEKNGLGTAIELAPRFFEQVPEDSIDYAVMEKTKLASVVSCHIGWSDIGSWTALGELSPSDANGNRIVGDAVVEGTSNTTIHAENRLIGAVGLKDMIIIETADAVLVADRNKAQDVKKIYSKLKLMGHEAYKHHATVQRPWGSYTVLSEGPNFKLKRIEVKPNNSLSLQYHHHRSEHWVVISGTATVYNNDREMVLRANESTFIPAGHKHRLSNQSAEMIIMIEVQTGSYLGEDDIVRISDIYGRS
jgi:mannose-1-phosphate guanylyltransferase/mannose-6-phosphate isomerase